MFLDDAKTQTNTGGTDTVETLGIGGGDTDIIIFITNGGRVGEDFTIRPFHAHVRLHIAFEMGTHSVMSALTLS